MPRWRHDSVFGDGLRQPLDREQRAQWRGRLRWLYMLGKITAKCLLIGLAMVDFLGADGRLDPSHEAIGRRARAGARTVRRALAALRDLGMLRWVRRLVRNGTEVAQTSNAYELVLGGGHHGRGTRKHISKAAQEGRTAPPQPSNRNSEADRRSLARIRQAMTTRLTQTWHKSFSIAGKQLTRLDFAR